jgi:hypothetical protein
MILSFLYYRKSSATATAETLATAGMPATVGKLIVAGTNNSRDNKQQ